MLVVGIWGGERQFIHESGGFVLEVICIAHF